jgi:alkanesulfonate monooxygenase SsuD/methylene tetrahydromethanopterin reductase-like flavin-dependent oxidoreductase (luciferase family)
MIGGGGEKVTLRIAAKHADHWNVWGGPATLAAKGEILDGHCATVGRDPKKILRSAVMVLAMSDDAAEVEKLRKAYMVRMGADEEKARDTMLGGSVAQIQDKLGRLREAGVGMVFIPTFFLPADKKKALDRFITEVAPALR